MKAFHGLFVCTGQKNPCLVFSGAGEEMNLNEGRGRSILHGLEVDFHAARARSVVLAEIDALPGAEFKTAVAERHGLAESGQDRLQMRVAIALAVLIIRLVMRDERGEFLQDIVLYVRVGVLVDRDPGGRVRAVNVAHAAWDGLRKHAVDLLGNVDDLAVTVRFDSEFGQSRYFP